MKAQAKPKAIPAKTRAVQKASEGAPVNPPKKGGTLAVQMENGETPEAAMARCQASPTSNATVTVLMYHPLTSVDGGAADVNALQSELAKHSLEIRAGDMARPEAMLVAQAHSLDVIFNALAQRAARNLTAGYMDAGDRYMRMALKAQSQCRTTIEALVELKNPTGPTFVKQQNIAQNQQVNNGHPANNATSTHTRTHEKDITPTNGLLEAPNGERMDFGKACATGGAYQDVAAVGAVDRPKD